MREKEPLLRVQLEQAKWLANNTTYASSVGALGISGTSLEGFYAIAVTASDDTGFTATADPNFTDADCDPLILTVASGGETRSPATCW